MAEIGVAGTIIALAGTAMKLCHSLYKIADAIGTARHEASLVAAEVSAFSYALNAVSKCVDKPSADTEKLHQTVVVLLNCCHGVIADLEVELCVQDLAHPFMSSSKWAKFRVRIVWLFQRPKVCFLRQSMESLKMSLHLLVSAMDFNEAVTMHAPSDIVDSLKMQVEGHMISSNDATTEYMRQEQILMLGSHQDSEPDSSASEHSTDEDSKSEDGSDTGTEQSEASFRHSNSTLTLELQKRAPSQGETDMTYSSLEAQQMVHQLAMVMVQKSREPSSWSWNSSGRRADDVPSRKGHKRFSPQAGSEQHEEDVGDDDPDDKEYGGDHAIHERLRKLEDLLRAQPQGNTENRPASPLKRNEREQQRLDPSRRKISLEKLHELLMMQREEQRTQAEANSTEKKKPIKFKDAVGRKFSFPWHICCTWKGMEELIKQAFLHVDVIGQHVHDGHYDLVGPDGEIILPQVWETMVQPDWTITMHMWPMEEPEPKSPPPPPPFMTQGPSSPRPDDPWVGTNIREASWGKRRAGDIIGDAPTPHPSSVVSESSGRPLRDDRTEQGTWWARQTAKFKKYRQEEKGKK